MSKCMYTGTDFGTIGPAAEEIKICINIAINFKTTVTLDSNYY